MAPRGDAEGEGLSSPPRLNQPGDAVVSASVACSPSPLWPPALGGVEGGVDDGGSEALMFGGVGGW